MVGDFNTPHSAVIENLNTIDNDNQIFIGCYNQQ